jgi:hypothetical protein
MHRYGSSYNWGRSECLDRLERFFVQRGADGLGRLLQVAEGYCFTMARFSFDEKLERANQHNEILWLEFARWINLKFPPIFDQIP